MTTKSKATGTGQTAAKQTSEQTSSPASQGSKRTISPAERWLLISENAYARAQKRAFIGGDPFEDLLAAEQEIDAKYDTDFESVFALTDPKEMAEQVKGVFAGYGFGQLGLDNLLEKHREGLEKIAQSNQQLVNTTSDLATRQTAMLQDVASEAMKTLQTFAQGWMRPQTSARPDDLPTEAMDNALSQLRALTRSAAETAAAARQAPAEGRRRDAAPGDIGIHGAVIKAYEGKSFAEIADAPAAALHGVSEADGKKLHEAFRITTVRDMGSNKFAKWARRIVALADNAEDEAKREAGLNINEAVTKAYRDKSPRKISDSPVDALSGVSKRQAKLLHDAFSIDTVRDLANNRFFGIARAISILAETDI